MATQKEQRELELDSALKNEREKTRVLEREQVRNKF